MNIEKEIIELKKRNENVDAQKAWEISWMRKVLILLTTYFSVAVYLHFLGVNEAWLHAIVPAMAFTLSTLSFSVVKRYWIKNYTQK